MDKLEKNYLSKNVLKFQVLNSVRRSTGNRVRISLGPNVIIMCKNLALYIRDCVSLCLSDETLKAVGPFYLVSMPEEVKDPTSLHWKCVICRDSTF